jgi:hypothetical protein
LISTKIFTKLRLDLSKGDLVVGRSLGLFEGFDGGLLYFEKGG